MAEEWRARWQLITGLVPELLHRSICGGRGPQTIRLIPQPGRPHTVEVTKRNDALDFTINVSNENFFGTYLYRLPVVLHLVARTAPSVKNVWCDIGDVCPADKPGMLGFCSNHDQSILIPDCGFFNTNAYEEMRVELGSQRPWRERQNEIIWRGSTTGIGRPADDEISLDAPDVKPRIRMCAILKSQKDVDAKIFQCVQSDAQLQEKRLRQEGLFEPDRIHERLWLDRKYAIDIDGNSNAWSNLFIRLLFGCCVIKISSPKGFRQWYYDRIEPWKHYVPVKADLSDLVDQIDWCRGHEDACSDIAAAGQRVAMSLTLKRELPVAVRMLNQRLG